jgi:preprotein translocase subunit YajC
MFRNKTGFFALLTVVCVATLAYCQEIAANRQITTISGTLSEVDFVGSTIVVDTGGEQVELSVPDDVMITAGSEKLGLVDLGETDPVTVEYYSPSSDQHIAVSIVDNNAMLE